MAFAYFLAHAPQGFWPIENRGELAEPYCFLFCISPPDGRCFETFRRIKLLKAAKPEMAFHDFPAYEQLVEAAEAIDANSYLIVLLGGEAGLRCGEMLALAWTDVDLNTRQLCIQRSDWNGHITAPKGGRLRYVPLTVRLEAALRGHRHLLSDRVLCQDDGRPLWRSGRPGSLLTLAPGRRRRSPASGSHRTERADFPHSALRKLIHSTASACSSRCGRRKRGRCNGCLAFIW